MNPHVNIIDIQLKYNWKETWHEIKEHYKYKD